MPERDEARQSRAPGRQPDRSGGSASARRPLSIVALALCLATIRADAQLTAAPRTAADAGTAVRAARPPVIDGRSDDDVWTLAPPMTRFRQFQPGEDLDPTFATEVRAAYDDHYLYVIVRAFDPHPDSIQKLLSRRDVKTASDQLKIVIDAYHDRRSGVELMVNPAGVKRDGSIYSDVTEDMSWDGVWDAGVTVDALGWIAEFRVPFSQLRFNPKETHEFGFGVWRDIARLNERDAWPVYRTSINALASQLGTLGGITGIGPPRRLELLPYAVVKNVTEPTATAFRGVNRATLGLDVKAGLTSNLTLDATVNPDFGQVEADPAVLNLSAFEIRFEERRPFFQEGAGLYRCAGPCEGIFYTRRIGRSPQLRASANDPAFTNITGAAKLTGRFGNGVAIGVIDAVTERVTGGAATTIEPRTNYLIFRALRELNGGRAQFGTEVTDVRRQLDAATEPYLRRAATAAIFQGYANLWNDEWRAMAYLGLSRVEGSRSAIAYTQQNSVHYFQRPDHEARYDSTRTSLGGEAVGAALTKLKGSLRYELRLRAASAGIELNDLGFVSLVNDIQVRHEFQLFQLVPSRLFRQAFSLISAEQHWTTGGLPAAQLVSLHTSASFNNNWGGAITGSLSDLGGANCVSCARGGPALRQSPKQGIRFDLVGDPRPLVVPSAALRVGASDEGRSWYRGGDLGASVRLASRFSASLAASFDEVVNDQQWVANYGSMFSDTSHYTFARLDQSILALTARANWTATPTLSFQLYAQPFVTSGAFSEWRQLAAPRSPTYDGRFRAYAGRAALDAYNFNFKQFNSNAVIRWEFRPASVLFLVWQQGRTDSALNAGTFDAPRDVRDLFSAHPDNTFLLKMSYWFNP
jgi:hypothetical protein